MRDGIPSIAPLIGPLSRGEIQVRVLRLDVEASAQGLQIRTFSRRESLAHHQLKAAAVTWMRSCGAADARVEQWCPVGKADAHSASHAWVVECGNTHMRKLFDAIEQDGVRRFTLIPYQPMAWRDGSPRRLIAAEFLWDAALPAVLQAETNAANAEAMRRWEDAERSPLNATRFGRA